MPTPEIQALLDERDGLLAQKQAASLRLQVKALRAAGGETETGPLVESNFGGYPEIVDTAAFINDDPNFGFPLPNIYSTLNDRQFGKLFPYYQNEQDLMRIRGAVHNLPLTGSGGTASGVLDSLANYVLGKGFTFKVKPRDEKDDGSGPICVALQRVIDEFIDENGMDGSGIDREAHNRSREDGEAFLTLQPRKGGKIYAHFAECEQITQPGSPRGLEEWLGYFNNGDGFPYDWWFGIHTHHRRTDEPLGYHLIYDGIAGDYEYIPAGDEQAPAPCYEDDFGSRVLPWRMEHFKRNVPANAKRGISDYYWVIGDLQRESKIRRNTAEGVALQAAIAWILETPAGTLSADADSIGSQDWFTQYQKPILYGSSKPQNVNRYPPGTILKPSYGMKYQSGPMGSERCPNFMLVAQYVMRSIGVRWNMPEYLISGDASNANYASSLVSESPFVKGREADQRFYKRHFAGMLWKVLRLAYEMGRFQALGASWETIRALIEIKIDAPMVASRDELKMAETQQVQIGLGILSRPTAAAQAGLDFESEKSLGAAPVQDLAKEKQGGLPGTLKKDDEEQDGGMLKNAVAEAMESAADLKEARDNLLESMGIIPEQVAATAARIASEKEVPAPPPIVTNVNLPKRGGVKRKLIRDRRGLVEQIIEEPF